MKNYRFLADGKRDNAFFGWYKCYSNHPYDVDKILNGKDLNVYEHMLEPYHLGDITRPYDGSIFEGELDGMYGIRQHEDYNVSDNPKTWFNVRVWLFVYRRVD